MYSIVQQSKNFNNYKKKKKVQTINNSKNGDYIFEMISAVHLPFKEPLCTYNVVRL